MSGDSRCNHSSKFPKRERIPLTLKVAIFTSALFGVEAKFLSKSNTYTLPHQHKRAKSCRANVARGWQPSPLQFIRSERGKTVVGQAHSCLAGADYCLCRELAQ